MPTLVDEMRSAGFDDDTIGSWASEQKPAMKQAGFDDDTIEGYFGGLKKPGSIPKPFLQRVRGVLERPFEAFGEGFKENIGPMPTAPTPEDNAKLRDLGVYDNGTGNVAMRGLRIANEGLVPVMHYAAQAAEKMLAVPYAAMVGVGGRIE